MVLTSLNDIKLLRGTITSDFTAQLNSTKKDIKENTPGKKTLQFFYE